ncbi:MAG: ABC transporter permease [Armatimonadetes bacterium]|nr:ABC transporter permease [Armatimonadota bacterium]
MTWRRLWAICRKEWIQIRRDPRTLAVVWALPLSQLILYGYAMDFDLKNIRIAVVDYDRSAASRRLLDDFERNEHFVIERRLERAGDAERFVAAGEVRQAIIVPRGFQRALRRDEAAPVQVLLDGADPITGGTALGYTQGLVGRFSSEYGSMGVRGYGGMGEPDSRPAASPGSAAEGATASALPYAHTPTLPYSRAPALPRAAVDIRTRVLYNPELRSTNFIVPGLIAVLLTMLAALLTSNTVVRERERGTFEALIATPVRPIELMVGKLIPYVLLAFAQVFLVVIAGRVLFGVRLQGSLALLAGLSLVFLLAALGFGLLISTVARTQQLALMAAIMATVIPSMLLSGFAFPLRNMPGVLRLFSNVFPATHYLVIVRGIYLKGVGMEVLWRPTLVLMGFALLLLAACARRFRKEL